MQTFRDLFLKAAHTFGQNSASITMPRNSEIPVRGRMKKLKMPKTLEAFGNICDASTQGFPADHVALLPVARLFLLTDPHMSYEGESPTDDEIIALGANAERVKTLGARRIVTATAVLINSRKWYGEAEFIYLSNGLGFGSPQLLSFRDRWTTDLSELAAWLARDLENAFSLLDLRPEANSPAWTKAALLLGGGASDRLPATWKSSIEFAAGLYCIALDIWQNPDSSRPAVVAELKQSPPSVLFVWKRWVADPYVYIDTYRKARPDGKADTIGENRNTPLRFYEDIYEIALHLEAVSPLTSDNTGAATITSWRHAKERILALECDSFVLTERARASLAGNAYPDPHRMFVYVERLARLASAYADANGNFGERIATVAESYEIEIALTDDSLAVSLITFGDSTGLDPTPHVKVDDNKSPDKCGRIYFAIDREKLRFVVDHIGLHDY